MALTYSAFTLVCLVELTVFVTGDHPFPLEQSIPFRPLKPSSSDRNYIFGQRQWPNKIIPYVIDDIFNATDKKIMLKAMRKIERAGCTKFRPRTEADRDFIQFTNSSVQPGCNSELGYKGPNYVSHYGLATGAHRVNIMKPGCVAEGTIVHELLHTHGAEHEHMRFDRDDFITINWTNIKPDWWYSFFKKRDIAEMGEEISSSPLCDWKDVNAAPAYLDRCVDPGGYFTTYGLPYDYDSIMHYERFLSIAVDQTLPVMTPRNSSVTSTGNREKMTTLDILKLKRAYLCDDNSL